jgi:hypothetical protein
VLIGVRLGRGFLARYAIMSGIEAALAAAATIRRAAEQQHDRVEETLRQGFSNIQAIATRATKFTV